MIDSGRHPVSDDTASVSEHRLQAATERFLPFGETLYLMMTIDGEANEAERDAIRGTMHMLSGGALPDHKLDDILANCATRAAEFGVEACLQHIGAHLASDRLERETAFTLAGAVALADNRLRDSESELLYEIAEWFGISRKRADELLGEL